MLSLSSYSSNRWFFSALNTILLIFQVQCLCHFPLKRLSCPLQIDHFLLKPHLDEALFSLESRVDTMTPRGPGNKKTQDKQQCARHVPEAGNKRAIWSPGIQTWDPLDKEHLLRDCEWPQGGAIPHWRPTVPSALESMNLISPSSQGFEAKGLLLSILLMRSPRFIWKREVTCPKPHTTANNRAEIWA